MKTFWTFGAIALAMTGVCVAVSACSGGTTGSDAGSGTDTAVTPDTGGTADVIRADAVSEAGRADAAGTADVAGDTMLDPVCSDPNQLTSACATCLTGQSNTAACIQSFVTTCSADTSANGCADYLACQNTCAGASQDAGVTGGGGGTACVAGEATGDAGSPADNCVACCQNTNPNGFNTFALTLITDCACTAAAPCATACM